MSRLDVVIPTHNAPGEHLRDALESALACEQTGRIVIVDDGSDEPVRLASGNERWGRVELVRKEQGGPSSARNLGVERTTAPWVLFLDHDDMLVPDGVPAMVALAERTGAGASVAARFEEPTGSFPTLRPAPPEWADRSLESPADVFTPIALFGASGLLVSRRVLDAGVRFDEELWIGEDRDFLARAARVAPVCVSSEPAVHVRLHRGRKNLSSPEHYARRASDHLKLLDRYHDRESDASFRAGTLWLLGRCARAGVDERTWRTLTDAIKGRGWRVPLKAKLRWELRRTLGRVALR